MPCHGWAVDAIARYQLEHAREVRRSETLGGVQSKPTVRSVYSWCCKGKDGERGWRQQSRAVGRSARGKAGPPGEACWRVTGGLGGVAGHSSHWLCCCSNTRESSLLTLVQVRCLQPSNREFFQLQGLRCAPARCAESHGRRSACHCVVFRDAEPASRPAVAILGAAPPASRTTVAILGRPRGRSAAEHCGLPASPVPLRASP